MMLCLTCSGSFHPAILISFSAAVSLEQSCVNGPIFVITVSQMSESSLASDGLAVIILSNHRTIPCRVSLDASDASFLNSAILSET